MKRQINITWKRLVKETIFHIKNHNITYTMIISQLRCIALHTCTHSYALNYQLFTLLYMPPYQFTFTTKI